MKQIVADLDVMLDRVVHLYNRSGTPDKHLERMVDALYHLSDAKDILGYIIHTEEKKAKSPYPPPDGTKGSEGSYYKSLMKGPTDTIITGQGMMEDEA